MTEDRLDGLLDQFLETGELPSQASPEERAELLALADAAGLLRAARVDARDEAAASAPIARARFERYRARAQDPVPTRAPRAQRARRGWLTFGSLAAAAVIGLAVVAALQPFGRRTESAQAIQAGDFVQLEGTVESTGATGAGQVLTLTTAVGDIEVIVSGETAVTDGSASLDPSALRPGQGVLFAGVAGADGRIAASTLTAPVGFEARQHTGYDRAREILERVGGTVILFSLAEDGSSAELLVELDGGRRLLVPVAPDAMRRLAAARPDLIGVRVTVESAADREEFTVSLEDETGTPAGHFVTLSGTVESIDRAQLTLTSADGDLVVRLRRDTRILLPSGVEPGRPIIAARLLPGREVTVQGAELRDGSLAADLIVVAD